MWSFHVKPTYTFISPKFNVAKALDLQLAGCEFNSRPRRCQVTTLGKLFTPTCLSRSQWFSDGSVRGRGQLCLSWQPLRLYSLGHGLRTLPAVPRSTHPSTLRGTVKWVSVFGLSNNNKWRWWMWMVAAIYRRTHSPSQLAWSEGWRPPGTQSAFIKWTGWTLAVTMVMRTVPQTLSLIIIIIIIIKYSLNFYKRWPIRPTLNINFVGKGDSGVQTSDWRRRVPEYEKIAYFPKFKQVTWPWPRPLGETTSFPV